MEKKKLGEKIKLARSRYGAKTGTKMTQQLLAEKIGVSRSYIGDIESGRTYPTFIVLNAIAEACGLSLNELADCSAPYPDELYTDPSPSVQSEDFFGNRDPRFSAVPVLGYIHAGDPGYACENIIGYEFLPTELTKSGRYFGLKVVGDSMTNSRIFDGDVVLIRQQEEVENGEIAVVLVNGEDATVKRFFRTSTMITLMPDSSNKEHQPRFFNASGNEVKVLGKVVKVVINIR